MNTVRHSLPRIIRLCLISWTPAVTPRPPRPPPRHLLPRSSRVTRPVPPRPRTLHPKTTVTTALTSQVSVWTRQEVLVASEVIINGVFIVHAFLRVRNSKPKIFI